LNREEKAEDLIVSSSDGQPLPCNARLTATEKEQRIARFYRPYHNFLREWVASRGSEAALVSVHSFTPQRAADSAERPWKIGVLYHKANALTDQLLKNLKEEPGLCVGDNQPYDQRLISAGAAMLHAAPLDLPYAELEVRFDGLQSAEDVERWADRLSKILLSSL